MCEMMQFYSTGTVCFCFYVYILRKHEQCVCVSVCTLSVCVCVCLYSRIGEIQPLRAGFKLNFFILPGRKAFAKRAQVRALSTCRMENPA